MIAARIYRHAFQVSVILFFLFSTGMAIKCFQCNSAEHPECENLTVNDTSSQYFKDCNDSEVKKEPFCRKVLTEIVVLEGSTRIVRSCGWIHSRQKREDSCRKADTDFIKKRHCECYTDACNSSDMISSSFATLMGLAIVFNVFR